MPACNGRVWTWPPASRSIASANGPQREPTSVTSSTIAGQSVIGVSPWNVDFITTVPRGRTSSIARVSPAGRPVTSTVTSNVDGVDRRLTAWRPDRGLGPLAASGRASRRVSPPRRSCAALERQVVPSGHLRPHRPGRARRCQLARESRKRLRSVQSARRSRRRACPAPSGSWLPAARDGREGAGTPDDAEDGACWAVVGGVGLAPVAVTTADVNFADDPAADPVLVAIWRRLHNPDELVIRYAGETGVPPQNLEVGAADAG